MVGVLTPHPRLALLIVAALAVMPEVLVMDAVLLDESPPASGVLVWATDGAGALVATPARASSMPVAVRAALATATVAAVAAAVPLRGRRHRSVQRLHAPLGDVGDAWRALLLGALPAFL